MVQYYKKIFIFARNLLENAMKKLKTIISAVVFLAAATTYAQKNQEIVLWPNGAPTSNGVDTDTAKVYVSLRGKVVDKDWPCRLGEEKLHTADRWYELRQLCTTLPYRGHTNGAYGQQ